VVPSGELRAGQRAAVEGEVQLTEVVLRGRRQMLCRIADGSGFLTLRFFYFTAQQQRRSRAACACAASARRGAVPGPGDRAPGVPARRSPRRRGADGAPDADLSRDRGRHPGTAADAGGHGARSDGRRRPRGLAAGRGARRFARLPSLREALHTCTGRRRMRRSSCCWMGAIRRSAAWRSRNCSRTSCR
jgi:hypothetical protein